MYSSDERENGIGRASFDEVAGEQSAAEMQD